MAEKQQLIDIDLLAAALPDSEAPCGPDLEYDPEFTSLLVAAAGTPERESGGTVIPAEEPNWADVRRRTESLLARTKDVRLAILLARALARTENITGLARGLELIFELLSRHWDHVHPQLDASEDFDPTMRINALAPLTDATAILNDLRAAMLLPAGYPRRISVRDILSHLGKLPPVEGGPTEVEMQSILMNAAGQNDVPIADLQAALRAALEIRRLLVEKIGSEQALDLSPLTDTLKVVSHWIEKLVGVDAAGGKSDADAGEAASENRAATPAGELRSREDAVRLLDRVCSFLERTEPTNPAPLFIRRAQQLLTMSFMDIVGDLAPDSLGQIKKMVGLDRD